MSFVETERRPEAAELTMEQRFQKELEAILKVSTLADFPEALTPVQYDCEDLKRWRGNE